jgi:hypothetical protein
MLRIRSTATALPTSAITQQSDVVSETIASKSPCNDPRSGNFSDTQARRLTRDGGSFDGGPISGHYGESGGIPTTDDLSL